MANGERTLSGQGGEPEDTLTAYSPEPNDAAVDTWRPPPIVGRYYLEHLLGCGGMGQVHRAWDTDLRRRVAIKFILAIEPDATARQRFVVEACATARIQHPNVLTIHDVDEVDGRPYLVMEYLSGRTLDRIGKPIHWSRALEIGIALSGGLAAAHRQGVLHRDIKPNNAMLTDDGLVKLLDFGLAKLATRRSTPNPSPPPVAPTLRARGAGDAARAEDTQPAALTNTGAIVGTPGYMAPECWLGNATSQSDVYSLGALLFELCAGRTPYAEVALHALSATQQARDAVPLIEVAPSVDPSFAAVIHRCLARDPSARHASGEELYEALKALERPAGSRPFPGVDPYLPTSRSRGAGRAGPTMVFREVGPLVVSVHAAEAPAEVEWNRYLELCRAKMARERIGVLVLTAGGSPSAKQRMALRDILPEGPVLAAVVTDVHTVRGTVTAMGWFNPGIRAFGFDRGAGLLEALKYLGAGEPMTERVLAEIAAMQRELRS